MRIVRSTIVCLSLVCAGSAAAQRTEKEDTKPRLSKALPERLAAFVTKSGADRDLTDAEVAEVAKLRAGEAGLDLIVKLVRPAKVIEKNASPVMVENAKEATQIDRPEKSAVPVLIAVSKVVLGDGSELEVGDPLWAGDTIVSGVVLNAGDSEVMLSDEAGEVMVIGVGEIGSFAKCLKTCSTTCGTGSFACCNSNQEGTCVMCLCYPDGTNASCDGGGPGSTSCSAGVTK